MPLNELKPFSIAFGTIKEKQSIIDEVLVSIFKSPNSYTGEDVIEISCHGSVYIQQKILQMLIDNGARLAEPGEFTLRAFLNGKMDLSQAEAVADLIASASEASHRLAVSQMRGGFSKEIRQLRIQLLEFISLIELELDFSEEDVEFADRKQLSELVHQIKQLIDRLVRSFSLGNALKNGIPVAIVGEPNVGKSTLLNCLLNEDRAIVSDIPGTTRDSIEDTITIEGVLFRFIDTAGLRNSDDYVEKLGIERTHKTIDKAEIVILVTEARVQKISLNETIDNILQKQKKLIVVFNKIDINETNSVEGHSEKYKTIRLSAKERTNIEELLQSLVELSGYKNIPESDIVVTNTRHYEALQKSGEAINRVIEGIASNISGDFLAQDIREAIHYLGEITGEITTDEVLGNIFAKFCIGK